MKPTLVIMAAGIGSRYGGLKQIDPIGPNGEILIDYSVYDALRAGFGKIVFVINRDIEKSFKEKIGYKTEKIVDTKYVFQSVHDLPTGFSVPEGRVKPWGTAHAILSCKDVVNTPFAVVNADDFYGYSSFERIVKYLENLESLDRLDGYCLLGFNIENTLTDNGAVTRGVCSIDKNGYLTNISERTSIKKFSSDIKYTEDGENWVVIPRDSIVSMNMWGFTPNLFNELELLFPEFLGRNKDNLLKAEYHLPGAIDSIISTSQTKVKVLYTDERWYGVTYKEDKPIVKEAILKMIQQNIYPENLWG